MDILSDYLYFLKVKTVGLGARVKNRRNKTQHGPENISGLPGSTNVLEVHDYEFKVRPVSMAVFFSSYIKIYRSRHE